jgi:hypothetical protein
MQSFRFIIQTPICFRISPIGLNNIANRTRQNMEKKILITWNLNSSISKAAADKEDLHIQRRGR